MALDPSFIAALTAGAKASTAQQNAAMAEWEKNTFGGGDGGGAWNLGQGIIDILSTGGYGSAGLTYKLGQNVAAVQRGEGGAFLDLINPISNTDSIIKGITDRRTYSQNLEAMGMDKNVSPWVGLALDIGLDPLTYVTGGTIAGVRGIAQGAKAAAKVAEGSQRLQRASELAPDASKLISAFPAQVVDVGRPLTQDERLSNLLTGMSRGWTGARRARNVAVRDRQLERVYKKEAKRLIEDRGEVSIQGVLEAGQQGRQIADIVAQVPKVQKSAAKAQKAREAAGIADPVITPAAASAALSDALDVAPIASKDWGSVREVIAPLKSKFLESRQLPDTPVDFAAVKASREAGKIANLYKNAKNAPNDPKVKAAYDDFVKEVDDQYKYLTEDLGIEVVYVKTDPYNIKGKDGKMVPSPGAMMRDVTENRRLQVRDSSDDFATNPHPILSVDDNNKFRAVHDFFGHAASGRGFLADGEEAAWVSHSGMFSPNARRAMTTETRGQNSYYNAYNNFAEQKAFLLPDEYVFDPNYDIGEKLLASVDKAERSVRRANETVANLQTQQRSLNEFARNIPVGGEYLTGGRPKKAKFEFAKLRDQLDERLAEFRRAELPALATSAAKLEKLTSDDFFKIAAKNPEKRTAAEQALLDELSFVEVNISDLEALGDFTAAEKARNTSQVTMEQQAAWAKMMNADPKLQKVLRDNKTLYNNAKKAVTALKAEVKPLENALRDARLKNPTSKTTVKAENALAAKIDELDAAKARVADLEANGAPPTPGYTDFTMIDMPKFSADDYWQFRDLRRAAKPVPEEKRLTRVEDLSGPTAADLTKATKGKKAEPALSEYAQWAKDNPEASARRIELQKEMRDIRKGRPLSNLKAAERTRHDALDAEFRSIGPVTELGIGPRTVVNTMGDAFSGETIAGSRLGVTAGAVDRLVPGRSTTVTLADLSRIASSPKMAGRDAVVKAEADLAFNRKVTELAEEAKAGPQELKPWIDGFINRASADDTAVALIRYVAPELESAGPAFNAAREILEKALEGAIKKISPAGDEMLNPDDVAELIEEFLSGRDLEKAFDAAKGAIDLGAATSVRYHTDLDSLLTGLNAGTTKLTPRQTSQLSSLLGLPRNNLDAAKRLLATNVDSLSRAQKRQGNALIAQEKARTQYQNYALNLQPIKLAHALEAAGDANGAVVGAQVEQALDLKGQLDEVITQTEAEVARDAAPTPVRLSAEAAAQIDQLRSLGLVELNQSVNELAALTGKTRNEIVQSVIELLIPRREGRLGFAQGAIKIIRAIAKDRKQDPDVLLEEILSSGTRALTADESAKLSPRSIVFNQAGSEARYDFYIQAFRNSLANAFNKLPPGVSKEQALIAYESATNLAVESLIRILGVPVRTTENLAMKLRRSGVGNIADEIPGEIVPRISNVTFADILGLMAKTGNYELATQLRKVRGAKGEGPRNFLPSSLEGAWLVFKAASTAGESLEKGSPAWNEAMLALSTMYKAPAKATSNMPVDQLFKDAPQVVAARTLKGKNAAEIEKAADDYLSFLADNASEFMRLDESRAVVQVAIDSGPVYEQIATVYKALLSYTLQLNKFSSTARGAIAAGKLEQEYNAILSNYDKALDFLKTGDIGDPEVAQGLADVIGSIFGQSVTGVGTRKESRQVMLTIKQRLTQDLNTVRSIRSAMYGDDVAPAKPRMTATPDEQVKMRKARSSSIDENITIDHEIAQKAIQTVDNIPDPEITDAVRNADELTTTTNPGPAVESADGQLASMEQVLVDRLQKTGALTGEGLLRMLSGSHGMGKLGKTIINGIEHSNISSVINYGYGLRSIKRMFRGREDELRQAFIALQKYGAAEKVAIETNTELAELTAYLAAEKIPFGSEEALRYMQMSVDSLFGSEGGLGIIARTGIFARELNKAAGKMGLLKGGETGKGLVVANDASPEALEYFWTNARIDEMEDMDPLLFLHKAAAAIHNASAHIEIAHQFSYHFGKTAAEIARDGDNLADFVKIDPKSDFGRLMSSVETDRLFHREDIERMRYVVTYLNEDKTFSDSALKSILEISDRVTYVLKSTNTLWRPGHHVVSIIGETAMNTLAGVRPSAYQHVTRILAENRPNIYKSKENPFGAYIEMNAAKGMKVAPGALDNIFWITPEGKKQIIPDQIIMQLADRYGALVKPGSSLEDLLVEDRSLARGVFARFDRANDKLAVAASYRDNFFRLAHFIDELQKTKGAKSLEDAALNAATAVREWHPTVGGLSAWEKKYARRLVYFYTWQRLALTKIIMTAIEKPGIMTIPSKAQYAIADFNGYNPESFGDPWDPNGTYASWYTGSLFGPQFGNPFNPGQQDAWGVQVAVQPIDIFAQISKPFTIQPGEKPLDGIAVGFGELASANLNPVIKTLIESASQSKLGEGGDLPNPVQYTLGQIGVISTLAKTTGFGQDPNPYQTEQDRAENNARLWSNLLLGQRLTDYQTPASTYKWEQDQYLMMRRMAGLE